MFCSLRFLCFHQNTLKFNQDSKRRPKKKGNIEWPLYIPSLCPFKMIEILYIHTNACTHVVMILLYISLSTRFWRMFDIHGWNTDYFCSSVLLYIIGSRLFLTSREFNYMIDGLNPESRMLLIWFFFSLSFVFGITSVTIAFRQFTTKAVLSSIVTFIVNKEWMYFYAMSYLHGWMR